MADLLGAGLGDICGRDVRELPTPVLCLDVNIMAENIRTMSALCRRHGKTWRPHIKAHRCPMIMEHLREAGWHGVTCATVAEAQVAAAAGVRDILIANQVAGPNLERAVRLARVADIILTFDSAAQVEEANAVARRYWVTPRAIVELDIGMGRAGAPATEEALHVAEAIDRASNLRLGGIMGYEGHLLAWPDETEKQRLIWQALDKLADLAERMRRCGLPCEIVSAGGTGSCHVTVRHPAVTELQAGGLVLMDAFYRQKCRVPLFRFALTVEATVTSRPASDRAVIDAGRKTHDITLCEPVFLDPRDGVRIRYLSAEHGVLEIAPGGPDLRPGHRVRFVPGYSDFTTMLHRYVVAHRDGSVLGFWPFGARA